LAGSPHWLFWRFSCWLCFFQRSVAFPPRTHLLRPPQVGLSNQVVRPPNCSRSSLSTRKTVGQLADLATPRARAFLLQCILWMEERTGRLNLLVIRLHSKYPSCF